MGPYVRAPWRSVSTRSRRIALRLVAEVLAPLARRAGHPEITDRMLWRLHTDSEYEDEYRVVFREDDHWTIVGSVTRSDFVRTGQRMFEGLRRHGLTRGSAVLDVGCGTGRLTGHLAGHLSAAGRYVGLDIAEEAVRFCRERYARSNVTFVCGDGRTFPVTGTFDLVVFFSVFTHVYPDEMRAMLLESRRVLAPGGTVIASYWFSSDPGAYSKGLRTWTGNRTRIEYARDHLGRLVAAAGFEAREEDWGLGQKVLILRPRAAPPAVGPDAT